MDSKERAIAAPDDPPPKVTPQVAAEAATWVARLHGPGRTRDMELQCLAWQARSAAHRHAFERCTEVWMEVPSAARLAGYTPPPRTAPDDVRKGAKPRPKVLAMAALGVLLLAAAVGIRRLWPEGSEYRTAVGEARTVVLSDGTRMFLNTDTRLSVAFDRERRNVHIASGEVAFDVAKDASRPFVVAAGGSEVGALGTSFSVRLAPTGGDASGLLSVTLLEGQVSFRPAAGGDRRALAPDKAVVMHPGERVQLDRAPGGTAVTRQLLDRPRLDQITAWKRNEVVFDRTTLRDAVAEMNRYSRTPITLPDEPALADRLISGAYRTGDNLGFARAVAAVHGLAVREREDHLELAPGS
jgi:transmembrane sensor